MVDPYSFRNHVYKAKHRGKPTEKVYTAYNHILNINLSNGSASLRFRRTQVIHEQHRMCLFNHPPAPNGDYYARSGQRKFHEKTLNGH